LDEVTLANRLVKLIKKHSKDLIDDNIIDIHRQGYIKAVLSNNLYTVNINNQDYNLEARNGLTLSVNDVVLIMLFNGDINRAWIIDKKPKNL
jgi:hypothetical protein